MDWEHVLAVAAKTWGKRTCTYVADSGSRMLVLLSPFPSSAAEPGYPGV
jgi:hypothetical protein